MKLDMEHVLFWMDAIRNSQNKDRTLESFWKGQLRSKAWLINNLSPYAENSVSIDIHGGWNGVLASMLFQSNIICKHIRSVDIDQECEEIANTINKLEEMQGQFQALTADMCDVEITADIVINTSCEHITDEQYKKWMSHIPNNCLLVLQSNNYEILEHVIIAESLDHFVEQCNLSNIMWKGELELPLYKRFMVIGHV